MRLDLQRVRIIVISGDRTACVEAPDSKMTRPSRSRTVTCSHARRDGYPVGSLWPVAIVDRDISDEHALPNVDAFKRDLCGVGPEIRRPSSPLPYPAQRPTPPHSSSSRKRFSMRCMKKFPPTNVWRANPLRGAPSTDAMGVSSSTAGM